jgi:predicted transcriptional regulator
MAKDRKPAEVERDRHNVSRLYLQGMIQAQIAVELKISQPTVSRHIKELTAEWLVQRVYNINEAKARELAKVDNLEITYWEAWHRSLKDVVKKSKKASQNDGKAKGADLELRQEQSESVEPGAGEPRYLQGIQWCIERRCLILGVDAPKKIEGTGVPIQLIGVGIDPSKI